MRRIVWTRHALERLRTRALDRSKIDVTIRTPDFILPNKSSSDGSKIYRKTIGNRVYEAVVLEAGRGVLLIKSVWEDTNE